MKLRLRSDFRDFYDSAFDNAYGIVFERLTRTEMHRIEMMDHLKRMGYKVPRHGFTEQVIRQSRDFEADWVVHTDPLSHRGEGKLLMRGRVAIDQYPGRFTTEYSPESRGRTTRHLRIGRRLFCMLYISTDDWRSNCGNVYICGTFEMPRVNYGDWPIYAIDMLNNGLAIDLNTSPGMTGTGVENLITAKEVVDEIKGWYERQSNPA